MVISSQVDAVKPSTGKAQHSTMHAVLTLPLSTCRHIQKGKNPKTGAWQRKQDTAQALAYHFSAHTTAKYTCGRCMQKHVPTTQPRHTTAAQIRQQLAPTALLKIGPGDSNPRHPTPLNPRPVTQPAVELLPGFGNFLLVLSFAVPSTHTLAS